MQDPCPVKSEETRSKTWFHWQNKVFPNLLTATKHRQFAYFPAQGTIFPSEGALSCEWRKSKDGGGESGGGKGLSRALQSLWARAVPTTYIITPVWEWRALWFLQSCCCQQDTETPVPTQSIPFPTGGQACRTFASLLAPEMGRIKTCWIT